jgi:dTDP-4-dehydrorhamnose 3,5-epimerase-like enzyme
MQAKWFPIEPQSFLDDSGSLQVLDGPVLPFKPQRIFWVTEVPQGKTRGYHAHRTGHQALLCIRGTVSVKLFDGLIEQEFIIGPDSPGIHVLPGVWGEQTYLEPDSILLAISSVAFKESDYIRSKEEFELFLKQAE